MTPRILSVEGHQSGPVSTHLRRCGLTVETSAHAALLIVIVEVGSIVPIGERIARRRALLPEGTDLWACLPLNEAGWEETLRDCGATRILSPPQWTPALIAERVAAELAAHDWFDPIEALGMIGVSPAIRALQTRVRALAPVDEPVLIRGESGTGKELVAEALSAEGDRQPLLTINAGGLRGQMVETALFGHVKGAFTHATTNRSGAFREAGNGTLFLDEIGDLEIAHQVLLLRAIEYAEVRPVGADRPEHHSARVVLATHRDLEAACDAGTFRRDLYERLDFAQIHVPPLNARRMDVLLLARHFFEARRSNAFHAQPSLVLDALFALDWTNRNVRGLRNIVAGAVIAGGEIDLFALTLRRGRHRRADPNTVRFDPHAEDWSTVEARTRKAYIEALLVVCGHNRTLAAARYGVARSTFYVLLKELGIT